MLIRNIYHHLSASQFNFVSNFVDFRDWYQTDFFKQTEVYINITKKRKACSEIANHSLDNDGDISEKRGVDVIKSTQGFQKFG